MSVGEGWSHGDPEKDNTSNRQQVQLPVPQTLPVCPQGRAAHESVLLRAPQRHPPAGTPLHLQELVVFLCQPLRQRHQGGHPCGFCQAGEEAQDGRPGAQRPGRHHRGRPQVCLRLAAFEGQRLRHPAQDLHPPSGQREEPELEAAHGGAHLVFGRVPGRRRVGGRVCIRAEVEKQTGGGVHVRLPSQPAGQVQQQPERSGQAGTPGADPGRASAADRQRSFIRTSGGAGPDGVPAAQVLHLANYSPHPVVMLLGLPGVQFRTAAVLPQPKTAPEREVTSALHGDPSDHQTSSRRRPALCRSSCCAITSSLCKRTVYSQG